MIINETNRNLVCRENDADRLRREEFDYCEHQIFKQMENLPYLAEALQAIRGDALWRPGYRSFDDYIRRRFDLTPELATAIMTWAAK